MRARVPMLMLLPVLALAGGVGSCSDRESCTLPYVGPGLILTVVNDQTGEPICDARVTAQAVNDAAPLTLSSNGQCQYTGVYGGTFLVTVERTGFRSVTRSVDVGGECGYDATPLTIRLVPLS